MLTATSRVSAIRARALAPVITPAITLSLLGAVAHAQHCPPLPDASDVFVFEDRLPLYGATTATGRRSGTKTRSGSIE